MKMNLKILKYWKKCKREVAAEIQQARMFDPKERQKLLEKLDSNFDMFLHGVLRDIDLANSEYYTDQDFRWYKDNHDEFLASRGRFFKEQEGVKGDNPISAEAIELRKEYESKKTGPKKKLGSEWYGGK